MDMSIKHPKRIIIAISYLLLIFHFTAYANDSNSVPKVPKRKGLVLIDLKVDAPSAVMTLESTQQSTRRTQMVIKLVPSHGRWLIQPLPKGDYQILSIKVPYFDLPYVNHTEENPGWRIKVIAGKLNYVGRIEVAKERTENFVAIKKLNRLVTDLPHIQAELAVILAVYPLADGHYLRDDFAGTALETGANHD